MKKTLHIFLFFLFICSIANAKRVDEMDRNANPDINYDLIYSQDVSDTSENSHGTGKGLTIKNLLKAGKITVDGTNVGINTVNPTQQLEVVGTVKATSFIGDGSGLSGVGGGGTECSSASCDLNSSTTINGNPICQSDGTNCSTGTSGWVDGSSVIYPTVTTDNVGVGTFSVTSKLEVKGGGIKGELVNKGWELIPQDSSLNSAGVTFSEVNSMEVYKGELYLGYNVNSPGNTASTSKIYKYDGNTLTYLANIGSGTHFQGVTFLKEYKGNLYAGIQGSASGDGDIYVSTDSGVTWSKSYDNSTDKFAYSAVVFKGNLYAGMGYNTSVIRKFDGTTWSTAYAGLAGSGLVVSLYVYKGEMYAALGGTNAVIMRSSDGTTWASEASYPTAVYSEFNHFQEFRGKLYANVMKSASGANDIFVRDNSTGTWSIAVTALSGNQCWGMNVYNDVLYVGCSNSPNGAIIYKSMDGVTFTQDFQSNTSGLIYEYEAFKMINYNGSMYVGYGGNGLYSANIWKKTDSLGQLYDSDHKIVSKFISNTENYNFKDDFSSIHVTTPVVFDSNVGIGTTSISNALKVIGTVSATAFVGDGSGLTGISGGGSVTINTTSPMTGAGSGTSFTLGVDQSKLTLSSIGGAVTDAQVPNSITIDTATTASALATNPTACGSGDFVVDIAADGTLTCDTPSGGGGGVGIGTINPGTVGALTKYVSSTVIDDSPVLFEGGSNIGIGTTGPVQKLEVVGTVKATTFSGAGTSLTGTAASLTAGNVTTNANLTGGVTSVGNAATVVTNANLTGDVTSSGNATTLSSTYKGWTDGGTNIYPTATTDNIGIGTTTPYSDTKLTVKGGASTGTDDFIALFAQNGVTPEVTSVAGVAYKGVWTQGDGGAYYGARDVTNDIELLFGTSSLGAGFIGSVTSHPMQLRSNNTTYVTVMPTGNVGIGTTAPVGQLNVGTSYARIGTGGTNSNALAAGELYVQGDLEVDGTMYGNISGNAATVTTNANLSGDVTSSGNATTLSSTYKGWTDGGTTVYPTTTTDNVGIGTFTPVSGAILTIKGTIAGADAGQPFAITNANVGIGTTTAGSLLTVGSTGSFQVDTSGNTRVGIGTTTAGTIICVKSISSGTAVLGYCTGSLTNSICTTCN